LADSQCAKEKNMNIPAIELVLANTNATVVRQKLPRTTYGSKDAIIQILRDAIDMEESVRNIYAFSLEGKPNAGRDCYLAFLIEYQNDHFDLFDDSEMNMGNGAREYEIISIMQHISLLSNPNHLLYSIKRLPYQLRDIPPFQAACMIKSQSFKPLLPNWHAFTAIFNKDQQLHPKDIYQADDWEQLYDNAKSAIRDISICTVKHFIENAMNYENLYMGMIRGHEYRALMLVKDTQCKVCFVPVENAYEVYKEIRGKLDEFVFGDFLPESVLKSSGQRLLSFNKIELMPAVNGNLSWVFREFEGHDN
jgi:hypothetical protein